MRKIFFILSNIILILGCNERPDLITSFPPPEISGELEFPLSDLDIRKPQNLVELDSILQLAAKEEKPVLIDVTGLNCVNCRKMEVNVWRNEDVFPVLRDEFIIVSLYVDLKGWKDAALPLADDALLLLDSNVRSVHSWGEFEASHYKKRSQPVYDIVNSEFESLVKHTAAYSSHNAPIFFRNWLDEGLRNFKKTIRKTSQI